MSPKQEPWVDEYEQSFWRFYSVRAQVELPEEKQSIYGWSDYDATRAMWDHMKKCRVDRGPTKMPTSIVWEQFNGTFTNDSRIEGLQTELTCVCTKYRSVKVRYHGTMGDMIQGVLNEAIAGPADRSGEVPE